VFDSLLYVHRQVVFNVLGNFPSEHTVAITNSEEVSSSVLAQMWHHQVLILINLVGVFGTEASFGGE
jgi:hypothetical protein